MTATTPLVVPAVAFEPVPEWLPETSRLPFRSRVRHLMACHYAERALPIWLAHYPQDDRPTWAISLGMRCADGAAVIHGETAHHCRAPMFAPMAAVAAADAAYAVIEPGPSIPDAYAAAHAVNCARCSASPGSSEIAAQRERYAQRRLQSLYVPREWPSEWRTDAVRGVSEAIYASQDWQSVPVLADALVDAGCTDTNWLAWLRAEELRPHWHRGQWPFDFGRGV